jgi:alcohol dehydrogenase (NADP+)
VFSLCFCGLLLGHPQELYAEGKAKQEDLFITLKLHLGTLFVKGSLIVVGMTPSQIESQLDTTLAELQTTYLDLYLIHMPVPTCTVEEKTRPMRQQGWGLQDVWREMEKLNSSGKARAIGVSNCSAAVVNDMLCYAKIPPAVNQIERHPHLRQAKLLEFLAKEGNSHLFLCSMLTR